jgi:hypothetical protein
MDQKLWRRASSVEHWRVHRKRGKPFSTRPGRWRYRGAAAGRVTTLESGRSEPVARGFQMLDYDISANGRQVLMWTADRGLWMAPVDVKLTARTPSMGIPSSANAALLVRVSAIAASVSGRKAAQPGFLVGVNPRKFRHIVLPPVYIPGTDWKKGHERRTILLASFTRDCNRRIPLSQRS